MAEKKPYKPSPAPKITTRLWSTEVAEMDRIEGVDLIRKDPVYVFSNGRQFTERDPYEPPDVPQDPQP